MKDIVSWYETLITSKRNINQWKDPHTYICNGQQLNAWNIFHPLDPFGRDNCDKNLPLEQRTLQKPCVHHIVFKKNKTDLSTPMQLAFWIKTASSSELQEVQYYLL